MPLCNGGHITYIELDGAAMHNKKALKQLYKPWQNMALDTVQLIILLTVVSAVVITGLLGMNVQVAGMKMEANIERIRRITGYLVGDMSKWNSAKRSEEIDRVKHK